MIIIRWLALLPVVLLGKLATILCAPGAVSHTNGSHHAAGPT